VHLKGWVLKRGAGRIWIRREMDILCICNDNTKQLAYVYLSLLDQISLLTNHRKRSPTPFFIKINTHFFPWKK
jgi:hypothetical protein